MPAERGTDHYEEGFQLLGETSIGDAHPEEPRFDRLSTDEFTLEKGGDEPAEEQLFEDPFTDKTSVETVKEVVRKKTNRSIADIKIMRQPHLEIKELSWNPDVLSENVQAELKKAFQHNALTETHFNKAIERTLPPKKDWSFSIAPPQRGKVGLSEGVIHIPASPASNGLEIIASCLKLRGQEQEAGLTIIRKGDWIFLMMADGDRKHTREKHTARIALAWGKTLFKKVDEKDFGEKTQALNVLDKLVSNTVKNTHRMMLAEGVKKGSTSFTLVAIQTDDRYIATYNLGNSDGLLREQKEGEPDQSEEIIWPQNESTMNPQTMERLPSEERPTLDGKKYATEERMEPGIHRISRKTPPPEGVTRTVRDLGKETGTLGIRSAGCHHNMLAKKGRVPEAMIDRGVSIITHGVIRTTGRFPASTLSTLMNPRLGPLKQRAFAAMSIVETCQREAGKRDPLIGHRYTNTPGNGVQILVEWPKSPAEQLRSFAQKAIEGFAGRKYQTLKKAFGDTPDPGNRGLEFAKKHPQEAARILQGEAIHLITANRAQNPSDPRQNLQYVLRVIIGIYTLLNQQRTEGGINLDTFKMPELQSLSEYVDSLLEEASPEERKSSWYRSWRATIPQFCKEIPLENSPTIH